MESSLRILLFMSCAVLVSVNVVQAQSGTGASGGEPCQVAGCQNGGSCQTSGICFCTPPYIGNLCQQINCLTNFSLCQNGAICNEADNGCICRNGYTGAACEIPPTACISGPCLNGGNCTSNNTQTFNCTCAPQFTGTTCNRRNYCHPDPCKNNGTCQSLSRFYRCRCNGPYSGRNCTTYDPCRATECLNEAFCRNERSDTGTLVPKCVCRPGTYGDLCQFDTNECETGDGGCVNGGTCINIPFSFRCECPTQTSGQFCEIGINGTVVNPCTSNPCQNNGRCDSRQPWRVKCNCRPGWSGELCERSSCSYDSPINNYEYDYEPGFIEHLPRDAAYEQSEDYCLFGGTCTIADPSSLPTCECAIGYHGPRCFYRTTVLTEVAPILGPKSGGTDISFRGYNLNGTRDSHMISIGSLTCPVRFANNTLIVCTTPAVNTSSIDVPKNVTIRFRRSGVVLNVPEDFTYKRDPTITKIMPLESIISGGVKLIVTGTGLDVVGKPILQITVVYRGMPIHVFESLCEVINSTTMICPTPKLDILDADGNLNFNVIPPTTPEYPVGPGPGPGQPAKRRKRDVWVSNGGFFEKPLMLYSYLFSLHRHRRQADNNKVAELKINNETVEFYIGFKLDGVDAYRNLTETLPQYSRLTVYVDPKIIPWVQQQIITSGSKMLEMEGDGLTTGIQTTDYKVLIGSAECTNLQVYSNKIICTAPDSTPDPHPSDASSGSLTVRVHIGVFKDPFFVGKVTYKTSFFDNPQAKWGVIGACIVVGVILIAVIAICVARKVTG